MLDASEMKDVGNPTMRESREENQFGHQDVSLSIILVVLIFCGQGKGLQ